MQAMIASLKASHHGGHLPAWAYHTQWEEDHYATDLSQVRNLGPPSGHLGSSLEASDSEK
jgi:hypothetical protein